MMPLYRDIIRQSWRICRTRLFIWPLAFFASLVGIAGTFQIFFDISSYDARSFTTANLFTEGDFITSIFVGWSQSFNLIPWTSLSIDKIPLLIFFFLLLIFVLAITVIVISSEGGLIYALGNLLKRRQVKFMASFRVGLDKFWQIFSINLIYRLLYLIVLIIIILPLVLTIFQINIPSRLLLSFLVYLILIPAIIILDIVTRYSIMYIVLHNNTIKKAFFNSWLLFRINWIISLETAILILFLLVLTFFIVSAIIIPLITLFLTFFGTILAFSTIALQFAVIITMLVLITLMTIFITVFTAFQMSIWVGIFQKITSSKQHSKAHRISRHLPWLHNKITR